MPCSHTEGKASHKVDTTQPAYGVRLMASGAAPGVEWGCPRAGAALGAALYGVQVAGAAPTCTHGWLCRWEM